MATPTLSSFSTPSSTIATNLSRCRSSWFQQNQEAVNWTSRSLPERTQCRQGRVGSTSYHCSTRGDCSTNWNGYLIDAGKPTGSTFQWCVRPFYDSFAICSPSQTSLVINQGSFCTPLKDPGWQWGCSAKMARSMSQEGWKGWSPCNSHLYRLNNVPSVRVAHCSLSSNK